jgi:hypothetical protein
MADFKLDHAGLAAVLKLPGTAQMTHDWAEAVGTITTETIANVYGEDGDVVVDDYVTDRAASSVTVRHPLAKLWQVRDGLLTRTAATVGIEVVAR